jgi:transposase
VLQQEVDMYDTYPARMAECDQQLQKHLTTFTDKDDPDQPSSPETTSKGIRRKPQENAPQFDLSEQLQRIAGRDLTRIDGIDAMTAHTILSEVGLDMSRWKTDPLRHPGWGSVQTIESAEVRCCDEAREPLSTA